MMMIYVDKQQKLHFSTFKTQNIERENERQSAGRRSIRETVCVIVGVICLNDIKDT